MTLTESDLNKISEVVNARAERTEAYIDRRIEQSEAKMDLKIKDSAANVKVELSAQIDGTRNMIQGDLFQIGRDIKDLKKLKPQVQKLRRTAAVQ
jgi:hypothetical protein